MSHVDEGALHAYLDGALDEYPENEATRIRDHLEVCPQCAIRLDAERRVRQVASSILDLAVPRVDVPDFEELRAYVRATGPEGRTRASARLYRLGWAASVVLAIGAGWLVRDGQLADAARGSVLGRQVGPVTPRDDAPARSETAVSSNEDAVAERETVAAAAPTTSDSSAAAKASGARAEAPAASATVATQIPVDRVVAAGAQPEVSQDPARDVLTAPVASRADLDSLTRQAGAAAEVVVSSERARVPIAVPPVTEVRSPAVPPRSYAAAGAGGATSELRDRGADTRGDGEPVVARLEVGRANVLQRPAPSPPPAEDEADAPWMIVPGLPVVSYATLSEATAPTGLRVVQALPDGGILDVFHLPEGMQPDRLPPLEAGRNEVMALRDGSWIVLRAAADRDTLHVYLTRMMPR